jgi:hypothetical protein
MNECVLTENFSKRRDWDKVQNIAARTSAVLWAGREAQPANINNQRPKKIKNKIREPRTPSTRQAVVVILQAGCMMSGSC